ncbi:MAG: hypothetical protein KC635_11065 [Myxococcales bacterium]|nr:hypothetical protein [Myxococcales bacterium]MCB9733684.1 hypothetical protein [Deltaproteobacteria bacterium]
MATHSHTTSNDKSKKDTSKKAPSQKKDDQLQTADRVAGKKTKQEEQRGSDDTMSDRRGAKRIPENGESGKSLDTNTMSDQSGTKRR